MDIYKKIIYYTIIISLLLLYFLKPKLVSFILNLTIGRILAILVILYLSYSNILIGIIFTLLIIIIASYEIKKEGFIEGYLVNSALKSNANYLPPNVLKQTIPQADIEQQIYSYFTKEYCVNNGNSLHPNTDKQKAFNEVLNNPSMDYMSSQYQLANTGSKIISMICNNTSATDSYGNCLATGYTNPKCLYKNYVEPITKKMCTNAPVLLNIPAMVIRVGGSNWKYLIQQSDTSTTNIQSWWPDGQFSNVNYAPSNELSLQFRYFAEYWLNRNNVKSGNAIVIGWTAWAQRVIGTFYFKNLGNNQYWGKLNSDNSNSGSANFGPQQSYSMEFNWNSNGQPGSGQADGNAFYVSSIIPKGYESLANDPTISPFIQSNAEWWTTLHKSICSS